MGESTNSSFFTTSAASSTGKLNFETGTEHVIFELVMLIADITH